jgi:tRNA threonylcarbamoyladenosine biosynthesis protein TsaB
MSLLLGIETSSLRYAVVFGRDGQLLFDSGDEREAPADLAGLVERGLSAVGAKRHDIDAIAVDIGPGGLGAVRAGVSFANALAWSLARPVHPVTAFELIGFEAWRTVQAPILCLRATSHGNAYVGLYDGAGMTAMRYGPLAATVAAIAGTLPRLGVGGTSRDQVAAILPGCAIIDSGVAGARARSLIEIGLSGRAALDPATSRASPLTEQSRIFHEAG